MRVLFTLTPGTGSLHPLLPIAHALGSAGHSVALCSAASFRPDVEAAGFDFFPGGLDYDFARPDFNDILREAGDVPPTPELPGNHVFDWRLVHTFAGTAARRMAPDVIAAARAWGADLIVRERAEFGGFAAAEALGLPHASIEAPSTSALDQRALLTPPLSALCAVVGLPAASAPEMPYRYLNLCFMPRRFHGPDAIIPRTTHFLRHTNQSRPGEALPAWVTGLPHRPTVLASLGTIFYRIPGLLQAIIAALRDEPVNVVVAIGRDGDPKALGPQPANVHVERYLPQTLLLPHCSLFVTHAGFNSVKESLSFGVPMVAVPIAAEQPYTAERCVALGVADVVSPREWGPERIRAAARTVLGDPSYRQRAWTVQAEMSALPGLERAVDLLERLAEGSEPLPDETPTGSSCTSVEERPV